MEQQSYTDRPSLAQWNEVVAAVNGGLKAVVGYYIGNVTAPGDGTKDINLGFCPKAVLVVAEGIFFSQMSALIRPGCVYVQNNKTVARITDTGFTVGSACNGSTQLYPDLNNKGYGYVYVAWY